MGIHARGVISLSTDGPIKGIAYNLVWFRPIHHKRLVVDEAKVKGEDALAVAVGKGISDMSIRVVGYAISPSVGGGMGVVIAKSDGVGLGMVQFTYFKNQMYDAIAAM